MPGPGSYRSSAFEHAGNSEHRFVAGFRFGRDPAYALEKHSQGMGAAFIHESSRHDHVIHEVTGQKPVIRMDIGLGPDQPQSITTANRIEQQDAVDKLHASPREPQ